MKEVFEKIIERLEELIEQTYYKAVDGDTEAGIRNMAYHRAKAIVNRIAKEYSSSEEFCEWVRDNSEYDVYDTKCEKTHMFIDGSPSENEYEFCPYCGKKIKAVD